MKICNCLVFVLVAASCAVSPGCDASHAQAVHEHAAAAELEPTAVTVFGARALLFLEHPHLVRGESARFLAHFSVLADGEPVRSGRVALVIGDTTLAVDAPKRDGLFIPEGSLPDAGSFAARLTLESEQVRETFDLGQVVVHPDVHEAAHAAQAAAGEVPAGAVPFLLEQQWMIRLLLDEVAPRRLARRLVVPALARTPDGAEVEIRAPLAGRLSVPPSGHWPRQGERVDAGAVLGFVEPVLSAPELAQLEALSMEFELKTLEVEHGVHEAQTRLSFAEREHARIAKLHEHVLATAQELEGAERDLALARCELEALETTARKLEQMLAARSERRGGAVGPALRFAITAPISARVIESAAVEGAFVDAGDVLARVIDTSRMWVEARVSEFDLALVRKAPAGSVTFAALPAARFEVAGSALVLQPQVDADSRTLALRCELANSDGALVAGMLAQVELALEIVDAAVSVPLEAIVLDQGQPTAYVMLDGELFQKRELELGVKDGGFVEVRRGLAPGERVATRGAHLVKLAALSPASFGAGHAH